MLIESATHLGLVRENNEDRFLVKRFEDGSVLLAVADGMGGHAGGEVAAGLAMESLSNLDHTGADPLDKILRAILEAQSFILEASHFDRSLKGMGTTLTAVLVSGGSAHWAQVGDSRLYLFRDGKLHQITEDHTIPGMLLKKGEITREQARTHPYGNVLLKCIGCDLVDPDSGVFEVSDGDILMLSSDGLHDLIAEEQIESILGLDIGLKERLDTLVQKCLESGGRDNITGILGKI